MEVNTCVWDAVTAYYVQCKAMVFVYGLNGHPKETWTTKSVLACHKVRILTFGQRNLVSRLYCRYIYIYASSTEIPDVSINHWGLVAFADNCCLTAKLSTSSILILFLFVAHLPPSDLLDFKKDRQSILSDMGLLATSEVVTQDILAGYTDQLQDSAN